jgi:hypothetical protein
MANTYTQIYIHIVFAVQGTAQSDGLQAGSPGGSVSVRFPTPFHGSAR